MENFAVVVPTLNAAAEWRSFEQQLLLNVKPSQVLILDSSSNDNTVALARNAGFRVHEIPRASFNHGGTRQMGVNLLPNAEVIVFLTQDAVLADGSSIQRLGGAFADAKVAAAYGRQLPRVGATPIEAHARLHNYPACSNVRSFADRERFGFKTIFISNSFAAYRREALLSVGGFPSNVIFGEDTVLAGRLLMAGWKIAYVAEAAVYHSHDYTWAQEFRRYFDIGVLHSREPWMLEQFGTASGQGRVFVTSEIRYLWPRHWYRIPSAFFRTLLKWTGYRLGRRENRISPGIKRRLSLNRAFWQESQRASLN